MSGLETLPPDQRAVLQLIVKQGRGYADLAGLLKIDAGVVRARALAGIDALGTSAEEPPPPEQRAQIADYLLGQQDEGERIVTLAQLGEDAAACRWAQALHAHLAPLAREPLPEVPTPASANGAAPLAAAPQPPAPAASTTSQATPVSPRAPASPRGSSRLGGALLIGGVLAIVVVLAIVLLSGGGDGGPSSAATTPTRASTQTTATSTQPTTTNPQAAGRIVAQVNLAATPAGGSAVGIGFVQQAGAKRALGVEAQKLPANGAKDIYGLWLQGAAGRTFLGFVPNQVRRNGTFTVSATLPSNAKRYGQVLVTREPASAVPKQPGPTILSGSLTLP